jgi:hypothetical protein
LEIGVSFVKGVVVEGKYCDDLRVIARHYLGSPYRF